jgi:hypothetical protein
METFETLHKLGFLYDTSMPLKPKDAVWPFTFDYGIPIACQTGNCDSTSTFPGLWEVPMYSYSQDGVSDVATMDPVIGDYDATLALFKKNFLDFHYNGNRTPFGLWLHTAWFIADTTRVKLINEFIDWTFTVTNNQVYYVTPTQLIEWMKNPVGLDEIKNSPIFGCDNPKKFSGVETVCDGIDNNGDGKVDERLTLQCDVGGYNFHTCFQCPVSCPQADNPVPRLKPRGNCVFQPPEGGCVFG